MLTSKRPTILAAILLVLLAGYLSWPYVASRLEEPQENVAKEPPLAGANEVSSISVQRDANGRWTATVKYFYTGQPEGVGVRIGTFDGPTAPDLSDASKYPFAFFPAKRGQQQATAELHRPNGNDAIVTKRVAAQLVGTGRVLATLQIEQSIDWPTFETWFRDLEASRLTPPQNLERAVALIDTGNRGNVEEARSILERLLTQDPKLDAAYVELARVAMKTDWGPAGLRQAENYLKSAMQIDPDSVNAKVLLGYVFAHQGRHKPAEALFIEASKTETKTGGFGSIGASRWRCRERWTRPH